MCCYIHWEMKEEKRKKQRRIHLRIGHTPGDRHWRHHACANTIRLPNNLGHYAPGPLPPLRSGLCWLLRHLFSLKEGVGYHDPHPPIPCLQVWLCRPSPHAQLIFSSLWPNRTCLSVYYPNRPIGSAEKINKTVARSGGAYEKSQLDVFLGQV